MAQDVFYYGSYKNERYPAEKQVQAPFDILKYGDFQVWRNLEDMKEAVTAAGADGKVRIARVTVEIVEV